MTDHVLATCLFLDAHAEDAAELYVSLIPRSRITNRVIMDPNEPPLLVELELGGVPYVLMNGNPDYQPNHYASLQVYTDDQAQTDALWSRLLEGGEAGRCGWLTDRFGVAWQIVPRRLTELMNTRDAERAARVQAALMPMSKIDIAVLEAAAAEPATG